MASPSQSPARPVKVYVLAVLVGICFLLFGTLYVNHAEHYIRQNTIGQVRQATAQIGFALDDFLRDELRILQAAGSATHTAAVNEHLVYDLWNALTLTDSYTFVGVTDLAGSALWLSDDGKLVRKDLSQAQYIQAALAGRGNVGGPMLDTDGLNYTYPIAVPLVREGKPLGSLFAGLPEERLLTVLNHSLYAGLGTTYVVTAEGDFIVKSGTAPHKTADYNLFVDDPYISLTTAAEVRGDMALNQGGFIETIELDGTQRAAYEPLDTTNWYVFYFVPENHLLSGLGTLRQGIIAIIAVASALFLGFILLIRRIHVRNHKAAMRLVDEDPLTGGRTQRRFLQDAERTLRRTPSRAYSLCCFEIKGFKLINERFGRKTGERLLQYIANYLNAHFAANEPSCRIRQDTFALMMATCTLNLLEVRYQHLANYIADFPPIRAMGYKVEVYGGIYTSCADNNGLTVQDKLDRADAALEHAKEKNTSALEVYSDEVHAQETWAEEVEASMETALQNGEFKLYYQPKIDIQHNDRILGMEVLVRWYSPKHGVISPGRFIPLFERNGFVVKLDRYIFEEACKAYSAAMVDGYPEIVTAVNVSRRSLLNKDFVRSYIDIKEKYRIPDKFIELEFTESLVFENDTLFSSIVSELQNNGFLCSLDDFGAGYSSLNVLKNQQVDILKLDALFFRPGSNAARGFKLVNSIIAMAHELGMKTVAEGIEHDTQLQLLREAGCDAVQGNIFAKPMPLEEFKRFVVSWHGGVHKQKHARNF